MVSIDIVVLGNDSVFEIRAEKGMASVFSERKAGKAFLNKGYMYAIVFFLIYLKNCRCPKKNIGAGQKDRGPFAPLGTKIV